MKDKLILYAVCLCDLSVPFLEEKRSLFPSEQRKCSHQAVLKETKPLSLSYSKHMTHLSGWRKRRTGRYAASLNVLAQLNKEWLFKMSKNPERKIKTQPSYQPEPNADLTLLNMYRTSGGSPAESYTTAQSRKKILSNPKHLAYIRFQECGRRPSSHRLHRRWIVQPKETWEKLKRSPFVETK